MLRHRIKFSNTQHRNAVKTKLTEYKALPQPFMQLPMIQDTGIEAKEGSVGQEHRGADDGRDSILNNRDAAKASHGASSVPLTRRFYENFAQIQQHTLYPFGQEALTSMKDEPVKEMMSGERQRMPRKTYRKFQPVVTQSVDAAPWSDFDVDFKEKVKILSSSTAVKHHQMTNWLKKMSN
jgi:hypothetical protein